MLAIEPSFCILSILSNHIVTGVALVCVLNFNSCHVPLEYVCPVKKTIDDMRPFNTYENMAIDSFLAKGMNLLV